MLCVRSCEDSIPPPNLLPAHDQCETATTGDCTCTAISASRLGASDDGSDVRNGARYVVAPSLELRRGEALGLMCSDISITWKHGCEAKSACRAILSAEVCPARKGGGTLTVRRLLQTRAWLHGCTPEKSCGHRSRAAWRGSVAETKSRAGGRMVGLPHPVVEAIEERRVRQAAERDRAANL